MVSLYSRRKYSKAGFIWLCSAAFLLLSIGVASMQSNAQFPVIVEGRVWDQIGNPLEGANVTVEVYDDSMDLMDKKYYDATDEDGDYFVTFGEPEGYDIVIGDTIKVTATHLSKSQENSTTVIDAVCPIYRINVTIESLVIPEFGLGQSIGLPLVIIGVVAIFAVAARKRTR